MAHELDITNGITSFADSRRDAWHQLGQQVGHAMTAQEAMREAHLSGWNVRKMPLVIPQEPIITADGVTTPPALPVTGKYATVRTNPISGSVDYLGVVGESYRPFQNEASCELLDALVEESGAHFETAGALREGRETFVTMKLPEAMVLNGHDGSKDRTDFYIAALNSHDGTSAFRFLVTPVRIVCANTQTAAVARSKASFSIWHTDSATKAIAGAREALGLTFEYMEEFEAECRKLYTQEISVDQVKKLADELVGMKQAATDRQVDNRLKHSNGIVKLFIESPTVAPFAGTKLGAYNAVTEYADHFMDVRGRGARPEDLRAMRTLTSTTVRDLKLDAFRLLNA